MRLIVFLRRRLSADCFDGRLGFDVYGVANEKRLKPHLMAALSGNAAKLRLRSTPAPGVVASAARTSRSMLNPFQVAPSRLLLIETAPADRFFTRLKAGYFESVG
ncbi:MAG TPA: hypothetical protein V6D17_16785 [Candidatus Obscuribacterales bacterium]